MPEGIRPGQTPYGEGVSPRTRSLLDWFKAHPTATDALVSAVLYIPGVWQMIAYGKLQAGYERPDVRNFVTVTVVMVALVVRQRAPFTVLLVVLAGNVLLVAWSYPSTVAEVIAYLVAIYTVAAHRPLAVSTAGGVIAVVGYAVMVGAQSTAEERTAVGFTINVALIAGVWWLGRSMRLRRAYEAELEHRASRLEQARDTDARAARVEERSRIARELHDVVAHHVSVMTVQAGAARRIIDKSPGTAREAMETIEQTGRTALSEMRRIVGVLRTERDEAAPAAELTPQPGIHDVGGLIDSVRETGLSVQLWIEGEPHPLPPGVNLAAYRLIQEALTNTLKHAGPQARAWVRIHYGPHELSIQIEDDGRGVAASLAGSANGDGGVTGHGMVGMHERVALYGGRLRIGPRVGGGFEVRAVFPLD